MKKEEFLKGLSEFLPEDVFCNSLQIKFQCVGKQNVSELSKVAVEATKQLGEKWGCEFLVEVEPAFSSITVSCEV